MAAAEELVDEALWEGLPDLVRVQAGWYPGTRVLDLHSDEGRLGLDFAQDATGWTVYTAQEVEDPPGNLEQVEIGLPELPFEDDDLAAVVGAFVHERFEGWEEGLAEEIFRVLRPEGRVVLVFRAPAPRAPDVPRYLPRSVASSLGEAGFEHVMETTVLPLRDGSEIRRLRAMKPAE